MGSLLLSWVLMHTLLCVCPARMESLFPPVLLKSCNQIPLAFKVCFSRNSSSCCETSSLGSLTWGSEPSLQWVDFCGISVLQFLSQPSRGYGIWFYCDCAPPTISLRLLFCLWMWCIIFGEFQCLPVYDCSVVSCDSGALTRGSGHTSFYSAILNHSSLILSLFFLMSLAKALSILFIFSKNQLLVLWIFAIVFFVSISFISVLIFMTSFLLLTLGFFCSSFTSCFWCKVRLFIWEFSCFLRWDWIGINFPLTTAFAVSHRFWVVVFLLSFVSRFFKFVLWFLHWSLGYLVAHCSASMCLCFCCFFPVIDFQSHSIVVRKDAWYDFNFLKFSKAWFVTPVVVLSWRISVCTWKESVCCHFWVECPVNIS